MSKIKQIVVPTIEKEFFNVTIEGITSLITNSREHVDIDKNKRSGVKLIDTPEEQYRKSLYLTEDGKYGFPASGIKKACVDVCHTFLNNITKVWARGAFFIIGDILAIEGEPRMRRDIVTINRAPVPTYRAEFVEWAITCPIQFRPITTSVESILNLFENAGFHIGIGDWRPQKDGTHGMFGVRRE